MLQKQSILHARLRRCFWAFALTVLAPSPDADGNRCGDKSDVQ
jgi:hypothetical protein